MKKVFIVLLLFGALMSLSACADPPGIEDSFLPSSFFYYKAKEEGELLYPTVEPFIIVTPYLELPRGDYILLTNLYGTEMFRLSFFSDDKKVCYWEDNISHPYRFSDKGTLYIVEENCPGMGEKEISWNLQEEKAILDGEEIEVWILTGTTYFKE